MKKLTVKQWYSIWKFIASLVVVAISLLIYRESEWHTTRLADATIEEVFAMGFILLLIYKLSNL